MKTLLLNPPSYKDFDGGPGARYQSRSEVRSLWYPTWLCYPAGLIKDSRVLDAPAARLGLDETLAIAKDFKLIIIHTSSPSFHMDAKTAERIKANSADVLIGFVGPYVTVLPEETLNHSSAIDFVIRGEYDFAVRDLADGAKFSEVQGISYKEGEKLFSVGPAQNIKNLDDLPFVTPIYKRDLNMHDYDSGYIKCPYVSFYTGRGCVSRCTYCLWPQTFSKHNYRVRSVDNILEEIHITRQLFPKNREIFFDDDTFTDNRQQVKELSHHFGKIGFTWSANSKVTTDFETLKAMKAGGLRLLLVGYETGSQEILNNIKKGTRIKQALEFTKNCKKLGIMIHGCFIIGLPGETKATVEQTIAFAKEVDPDSLQVSLAAPYPGTEFHRYVADNNYFSSKGLVGVDGYQNPGVSYPEISEKELVAAVERLYRAFYFRPKVIARIMGRACLDFDDFKWRMRQAVEFGKALRQRKKDNVS